MSCLDELKHLFAAKTKCIWIKTHEEVNAIEQIKKYILNEKLPYTIKSWSIFSGLKDEPLITEGEAPKPDKSLASPEKLFAEIEAAQNNAERTPCIYILKDFHLTNENKLLIRGLRDLKDRLPKDVKSYQPIIVIAPTISIPLEHEKLFAVLELETPSKEQITKIVNGFVKKLKASATIKGYAIPSDETIQECINLSVGLTSNEIGSYLARSLSKYNTLSSDIFYEARINLINKTGLLELMPTKIGMNDMGGNHVFKEWIDDVKISMLPEASEFGVEKSKGYVGIGIPGQLNVV